MSSDLTPIVISQIVEHARINEEPGAHEVAAFFAKTVILNDPETFRLDQELDPEIISTLISRTARELQRQDEPSVETIKLQVKHKYLRKKFGTEQEKNHVKGTDEINKCLESIEGLEDFEQTWQKIKEAVSKIVKNLNLNRKINSEELSRALESVLPKHYLNSFLSQNFQEKQKKLKNLTRTIWGIILLNKEAGKGGNEVIELISELRKGPQQLKYYAQKTFEQIQEQVKNYIQIISSGNLKGSQLSRLANELNFYRQCKDILYKMRRELENVLLESNKSLNDFNDIITKTIEELNSSPTMPKTKIYPRFVKIAEKWKNMIFVEKEYQGLNNIHDLIKRCRDNFPSTLTSEVMETAYQEENQQEAHKEDRVQIESFESNDIDPDLVSSGEKSDIELGGYCPVTVSEEVPITQKGQVGPIEVNEKKYMFSSKEAEEEFIESPEEYLSKVNDQAIKHPELIHLLHLEDNIFTQSFQKFLDNVNNVTKLMEKESPQGKQTTDTSDISIETTGHLIERKKDPKYKFSEWELRKDLIKKVDLRNKRTKSQQTDKSHFRRDNETQVYLPREQSTQTKKDRGVNPIQTVRYIKNLRDKNDSATQVINIKFEL